MSKTCKKYYNIWLGYNSLIMIGELVNNTYIGTDYRIQHNKIVYINVLTSLSFIFKFWRYIYYFIVWIKPLCLFIIYSTNKRLNK